MPSVTWLGAGEGQAEVNTWRGLTFKKGEAVETDDKIILAEASKHPHYKVDGYEAEPTVDVEKEVTVKPPSQQTAQYPVPKHGDVKTLKATVPNPPDPVDPEEPPPDPPPEEPAQEPQVAPRATWPKI